MTMFELDQKYDRGRRTLTFILIHKGWKPFLLCVALFWLSYEIYYGRFRSATENFLNAHPDWYINVTMLAQWIVLVAVSILILTYVSAHVIYKHYKFILDDDAFHLHRGLFFIRETTIPYQQINNVLIAQPYHYRLLGIAQLDILTAADRSQAKSENRHRKYLIPIIDIKIARGLSKQLMGYSTKMKENHGQVDLDATDINELNESEGVDDTENE